MTRLQYLRRLVSSVEGPGPYGAIPASHDSSDVTPIPLVQIERESGCRDGRHRSRGGKGGYLVTDLTVEHADGSAEIAAEDAAGVAG